MRGTACQASLSRPRSTGSPSPPSCALPPAAPQAGLALFPSSSYMALLHANFMIEVLGVSQSGQRQVEVRAWTCNCGLPQWHVPTPTERTLMALRSFSSFYGSMYSEAVRKSACPWRILICLPYRDMWRGKALTAAPGMVVYTGPTGTIIKTTRALGDRLGCGLPCDPLARPPFRRPPGA